MKRSKQCPKCQSLKVGYLPFQPDQDEYQVRERTIGEDPNEGSFWNARKAWVGTLEAYLCSECGYYESYIKDVATLDFENLRGFRWVNPNSPEPTPYR